MEVNLSMTEAHACPRVVKLLLVGFQSLKSSLAVGVQPDNNSVLKQM